MFTPQQIQEQTFSKAVFGGYDMQQVDDFLEPLTEDYITLYKENANLRAKLTAVVNKLEELRTQESAAQQAVAEAQKKCDAMLLEAQRKCDAMLAGAAENAHNDDLLAQEDERLRCAKQTALSFIEVIERDIKGHLDLLQTLKTRDLSEDVKEERKPAREKPFDWSKQEPSFSEPSEDAAAIASEISDNLEKLVGAEPEEEKTATPAAPISHPESATIKFTDLKFGKNYDPTSN